MTLYDALNLNYSNMGGLNIYYMRKLNTFYMRKEISHYFADVFRTHVETNFKHIKNAVGSPINPTPIPKSVKF
jgi:hypothetical protein